MRSVLPRCLIGILHARIDRCRAMSKLRFGAQLPLHLQSRCRSWDFCRVSDLAPLTNGLLCVQSGQNSATAVHQCIFPVQKLFRNNRCGNPIGRTCSETLRSASLSEYCPKVVRHAHTFLRVTVKSSATIQSKRLTAPKKSLLGMLLGSGDSRWVSHQVQAGPVLVVQADCEVRAIEPFEDG